MMRLFAFSVCSVALGVSALAQSNPASASYELRLVPQGSASGLVSGGVSASPQITFFIQARATTAPGSNNWGVHQFNDAAITATAGMLARAPSTSGNFGRFRTPSPVTNFTGNAGSSVLAATNNASGNHASATSAFANANGRVLGTSITMIDAGRPLLSGAASLDVNGEPLPLPYPSITTGLPSDWANIYAFTVTVDPGAFFCAVAVTGLLSTPASFSDIQGFFVPALLPGISQTATFTWLVPTPGTALGISFTGLIAARRKREAVRR